MKRTVCLLIVAAFVLASTVPAHAFLGIGDVVFDPSVYVEAIQTVIQLEQQYQQLVATYTQIHGQYDQMKRMAQVVPVDMVSRYRSGATPWGNLSTQDVYSNDGAWVSAVNGNASAAAGYQQATTTLNDYGAAFANIPADQQQGVKNSYATVELADGANILGMQTIGQLRANGARMDQTISALEQDSLSSDPDMNTEMAVLNKMSAANIVGVRSSQDTNKLLVGIVEQQILDAKRVRDAEARAINTDVQFRTDGKAVLDAQAANSSEAMLAWQLP